MSLTQEQVKKLTGLTFVEVLERRRQFGTNELLQAGKKHLFKIILSVLSEPMFLLLVMVGLIYLVLGDVKEALALLASIGLILGITIYQENKTEKALEALKNLASPRALVIRNGERVRIAGNEVVIDDLVVISEGDRVPADGYLEWSQNLMVNESMLTGESVPVLKFAGNAKENLLPRPGGEQTPFVFSGTLVTAGQGIFLVKAIGSNTEMGKIGKALATIEEQKTPLQQETSKVVFKFSLIGGGLCVLLAIFYLFIYGDLLKGLLAGLTLAMAILPEEFPVVLTVFLALGAWRISQKKVLTRKINAVETLGAASVLCVDKTGTLTQNAMVIKKLCAARDQLNCFENASDFKNDLPESFHQLIEFAILASKTDPFDPMEQALWDLGFKHHEMADHLHVNWQMIKEYSLSKELLALSQVWAIGNDQNFTIAAKGAPEAIMDLCHLTSRQITKLNAEVEALATEGLRVIAVAKSNTFSQNLPATQHDFTFEFLGLIGFEDPVRPEIKEAVKQCYSAGIKVVMITGDYPGTAFAIAKKIGLTNPNQAITGQELSNLPIETLKQQLDSINIFARVVPEQKLKIIEAFQGKNQVTAMTGDGVNDAPALKAANIGIAMGERGSDVVREASDIVLLDDNFSSIVAAVRLGRRIYDNLKKAVAYIISVHVPIIGLALIPVLLKWPVVLMPMHVLFLELIIDPACSVVFEAEGEEKDIMNRPPRFKDASLFNKKTIAVSLLQGVVSLVLCLLVYKIALSQGLADNEGRAMAFATLVFSNLAMIFTNRSFKSSAWETLKRPNTALWYVVLLAVGFLGSAIYIPWLQELFKFSSLSARDLLLCFLAGGFCLVWFEIAKKLYFKKYRFN